MKKDSASKKSVATEEKSAKTEIKLLPAPKNNSELPLRETSRIQDAEKNLKKEKKQSRLFEPISNKSFIISQIVILSVGLIFAGLMYFFLQKPLDKHNDFANYIPVTTEPISFSLDLTAPNNNLVVFNDQVLINGTSSPNTTIMISTDDTDQALTANTKGEFSQTISLNPGLNTILINAFDNNGNNKAEIRNVYYSEEKL